MHLLIIALGHHASYRLQRCTDNANGNCVTARLRRGRNEEVLARIPLKVPAARPPEFSSQLYSSAEEFYESIAVVVGDSFSYGPTFQVGLQVSWHVHSHMLCH